MIAYLYKLTSSVREEIWGNHKQVLVTSCLLVLTRRKIFTFLMPDDVVDA